MKKIEKINRFCELLKDYHVTENEIDHFKKNALKHRLKKNEQYMLKDHKSLTSRGKIFQIWSTMNQGFSEFEYICSVKCKNCKKILVLS